MTPGFAPASTFKRPLNSGRAYSADTFCISNCASRNFKQPFFCEMSVTPTLPASARSSATCTSVYTLVQVALLRADAGKVGVTDISQKNGCLKFLLAQFDMQKVSALYARPEFKGRLKVDAGAKPGVILRLKTRTHVIEQARAFVSAWADAQGDRA